MSSLRSSSFSHTPYGIHSDDNIWRMQEFNVVEVTEERMAIVAPSRSCIRQCKMAMLVSTIQLWLVGSKGLSWQSILL